MDPRECSERSITFRLTLECEGLRGDVLEAMGRSLSLFAQFPQQNLASPEIEGAIGQVVPYNVLMNGLTFVATYGDFQPYESIEFYIESPGELTFRESVLISPQQAESGKVVHTTRADNVAYLAGKDIQIYIRLPARGPGWTSVRRPYSVESAP